MMSMQRIHSVSQLSRRAALARIGAGGLGVVLASGGLSAAAQVATPQAVEDLPQALQEYFAAWAEVDLDRVLATLTDNAILDEVPAGAMVEGQDAIREHYEVFFDAFSDATVQYTTAFSIGDWAAAEWMFSGSYTGELPDAPPGVGQQVTFRGVDIIELEGDQIHFVREYFDLFSFLLQLGALDDPVDPATPPA